MKHRAPALGSRGQRPSAVMVSAMYCPRSRTARIVTFAPRTRPLKLCPDGSATRVPAPTTKCPSPISVMRPTKMLSAGATVKPRAGYQAAAGPRRLSWPTGHSPDTPYSSERYSSGRCLPHVSWSQFPVLLTAPKHTWIVCPRATNFLVSCSQRLDQKTSDFAAVYTMPAAEDSAKCPTCGRPLSTAR